MSEQTPQDTLRNLSYTVKGYTLNAIAQAIDALDERDRRNASQSSHYDGCWQSHHECAVKEIERLSAEVNTLHDAHDRKNARAVSLNDEIERLREQYNAASVAHDCAVKAWNEARAECASIKQANERIADQLSGIASAIEGNPPREGSIYWHPCIAAIVEVKAEKDRFDKQRRALAKVNLALIEGLEVATLYDGLSEANATIEQQNQRIAELEARPADAQVAIYLRERTELNTKLSNAEDKIAELEAEHNRFESALGAISNSCENCVGSDELRTLASKALYNKPAGDALHSKYNCGEIDRLRFTIKELEGTINIGSVLNEQLKGKIAELEAELAHYKPPVTVPTEDPPSWSGMSNLTAILECIDPNPDVERAITENLHDLTGSDENLVGILPTPPVYVASNEPIAIEDLFDEVANMDIPDGDC